MEIRTVPMVRRTEPEQETEQPQRRIPENTERPPIRETGLPPIRVMREPEEQPSQEACYGVLPARAPLANPFVPFQQNNPPTYPAKQGIVRGTLYPGLNLPYLGKVNTEPLEDTPLQELQALSFALVELCEYLDTHPNDREAFALFRSYAKLHREGRERYEKQNGPLSLAAAADDEEYRWLRGPWPWEYRGQEG